MKEHNKPPVDPQRSLKYPKSPQNTPTEGTHDVPQNGPNFCRIALSSKNFKFSGCPEKLLSQILNGRKTRTSGEIRGEIFFCFQR